MRHELSSAVFGSTQADGATSADPPRRGPEVRFPLLRAVALAAIVLAGVGSTGCTHFKGWLHNGFKVGPNYRKPAAPVADNWIDFNERSEIAEPAHDRDWWRVFNDAHLDTLVQSAYQGNLPLRVAGLRILEARAQRAIAVGNLFPQQQTASGAYNHIQLSSAGNSFGVAPTSSVFDLWNVGAGLNWELDVWGRFRRRIESADATLDSRVEDYDDVLVLLVAETAQAYTDLRTSEERVRLARKNADIQAGSLRLATARFKAGAVSELDVTQARSTLEETEALIPRFETQLRQANNRLCTLLGIPPRDLTIDLGEGQIPVAPTTVAVGIPAELVRRRPDVRGAERKVAAQSALIGVAATDLFPEFSINGSFSWTASQLPDLFTPEAFGGVVGPSFRWKILNYGRIVNNVRVQDARFQQLAVSYQNTVLKANAEVEDALISFYKSQERTIRLTAAAEATQRSVELATTQYREGAIDFERIFNLQNVLVRQQDNLALSKADIALSLIGIYKALGGGWQIRLDMPLGAVPIPLPAVEEIVVPDADDAGIPRVDADLPPLPGDARADGAAPDDAGPDEAGAGLPDPPADDAADARPASQVEYSAAQQEPVTTANWRKKS